MRAVVKTRKCRELHEYEKRVSECYDIKNLVNKSVSCNLCKQLQQGCIPVGCVSSAAVAVFGEGCLPGGDVHPGGGCLPGGVCLGRGVCQGGEHLPPHRNRMADRCKNITFPQLRLRTVTILYLLKSETKDKI